MRTFRWSFVGLGLVLAAQPAVADDPRSSQQQRPTAQAVQAEAAPAEINHLKVRKGFKMAVKSATHPVAMKPDTARTPALRSGATNSGAVKQTRLAPEAKAAAAAAKPVKVAPGEKVNKLNPARAARMSGMMRSLSASVAKPIAQGEAIGGERGAPTNANPPMGAGN